MRVLVVYESMFGNTAELAEAIGAAFSGQAEVRVVAAQDSPPDPGPDVDLLVVGAPTHGLTLPRAESRQEAVQRGADPDRAGSGVREWLEGLPAGRSMPVATFGTRVRRGGPFAGSAARAAARLARRKGLTVRSSADFFVEGTTGPLEPGQRERAAAWASGLVPVPA